MFFVIDSLLKTSKPGKRLGSVEFIAYKADNHLSIIKHLEEYVKVTKVLRGIQAQLLISHQKPFKAVSADTISRWLTTTLAKAGVDTSIFDAHSTRSATNSGARHHKISIKTIMKSAGWAQETTII